jgi:hypothetical protein
MKNRFYPALNVGSLIAAATIFWTGSANSAPPEKPGAGTSSAADKQIPQSVYVVPANQKDGRDPFFPDSDRLKARVVVKSTPNTPSVTLVLNGLSPGLAMINGRTMAAGEESDVNSSGRRVHIRLVEIKDKEKTVVVEVDGERRELTLRGN